MKFQVEEDPMYASWFSYSFPRSAWTWPLPRARHRKAWRAIMEPVKGGDGDRYRLRADGIRNWIQGLVHRALKEGKKKEKENFEVAKESRAGPAITLKGAGLNLHFEHLMK
jgi:hypothetical protein